MQIHVDVFISEVVHETGVPIEKVVIGAFGVNYGEMDISDVVINQLFEQITETDVKSLVVQRITIRGSREHEKNVMIRFGCDTGI